MEKFDRYKSTIFIGIMLFCFVQGCRDNSANDNTLFTSIPPENSGIYFKNHLEETVRENILISEYFFNGAGVSAGDVNNDGLVDLYFVANQGENKLYLNKGDFNFEDITEDAGVSGKKKAWSTGSAMVDINNDGFLDILVSQSAIIKSHNTQNLVYVNNGDLTFTESSQHYGLNVSAQTSQMAFLDYDLDGDLDLFMLNHQVKEPQFKTFDEVLNKASAQAGDRLYRNDNGFFVDVSSEAGIISNPLGYGLGVSISDINNDGWPDIYVGNDFVERDYLYINQGNGTFFESSKKSLKHMPNFSMGNDIADFNNDGLTDIVALDMVAEDNYGIKTSMSGMNTDKFWTTVENGFGYQYMYNTLQINMGGERFSDVGKLTGVSSTDWSWAPLLADFDNDGQKDLFVTNGFRRNFRDNDFQVYKKEKYLSKQWSKQELPKLMLEFLERMPVKQISNYMFKNMGNLSFANKTKDWGLDEPSFSNGAVYADLDNDGDLDLVVNNIDQYAFVYRNNSEKVVGNSFLNFRFKGSPKNLDGIGAKVTIWHEGKQQYSEQYLVRGYLSSMAKGIHFGLGGISKIDSVRVQWPDGKEQKMGELRANANVLLDYADSKTPKRMNSLCQNNLFTEVTGQHNIDYIHRENDFDDYKQQLLLPHKYSQFGPALSVADVNGDGLDDFFVGGAIGQNGQLFIQTKEGEFRTLSEPWILDKDMEDVYSVFFDADNDGDQDLLVLSGGNEFVKGESELLDRLYFNNGKGQFSPAKPIMSNQAFSSSVAKPSDFDGDGFMDLFVGERHIPHEYPKLASGYLYKNDKGVFKDVTHKIAPGLSEVGLITDAIWSDIDGNGHEDLIVVGEWMGVTIYYNDEGVFHRKISIPDSEGWWYAVATADFDSDGDMDIVCGNLGLNYKYRASKEEPFEVFSSDFDNNGKRDIVLSFHERNKRYPLRGRECSSEQLPFIKKKFATYDAFAKSTINDLLGENEINSALKLMANTFATTLFENQNGVFKAQTLPRLAQLSSVNDIKIDDFDKDGRLDILLTGNLYTSEVETPRNDASYGCFLKGDGKGSFVGQYPYESGLLADGDIKRTVTIKIKGMEHLLVAQNDGPLRLFRIGK